MSQRARARLTLSIVLLSLLGIASSMFPLPASADHANPFSLSQPVVSNPTPNTTKYTWTLLGPSGEGVSHVVINTCLLGTATVQGGSGGAIQGYGNPDPSTGATGYKWEATGQDILVGSTFELTFNGLYDLSGTATYTLKKGGNQQGHDNSKSSTTGGPNCTPPAQSGTIRIDKNVTGTNASQSETFDFSDTGIPGDIPDLHHNSTPHDVVVPVGSNYSVSETLTALQTSNGWSLASATCTNGTPSSIVVTANTITTCTFVNNFTQPTGTIALDKNVTGTNASQTESFAFSDTGIPGSPANMNHNTPVQTFTVPVGNGYSLSENLTALQTSNGWSLASATCTNGTPSNIVVTANTTTTCTFTNNFTQPTAPPFSIAGSKYRDENGNGVQDAGDASVAGWVIKLLADPDNSGTLTGSELSAAAVATTTTDANGNFQFLNVPVGSYVVCEDAQPNAGSGWSQSQPSNSACQGVSGAATGGYVLTNRTTNSSGNVFGNRPPVTPPPGPPDCDNDGISDAQDQDDNNDCSAPPPPDCDNDGIPDAQDADDNNDCTTQPPPDCDNDGISDSLDTDDNNDCTGPPPPDCDNDGIPDGADMDDNNDCTVTPPPDCDNDGIADADDNDDNDDCTTAPPADCDLDGIPDAQDTNDNNDCQGVNPPDCDNDGLPDGADRDDNNNCSGPIVLPTIIEREDPAGNKPEAKDNDGPQVLPRLVTRPGRNLPLTGVEVGRLVLWAGMLIVSGGAALAPRRKRGRHSFH